MGSLEACYASDLQGVWALLPVPALFLVYLALGGGKQALRSGLPDARFVVVYGVVFASQTILDPLSAVAGRWLDVPVAVSTGLSFLFVWLGDFRVFAVVFPLDRRSRPWLRACAWACLVPAFDLLLYFGLVRRVWPEVPGQVLWLIHEAAFLAVALWLRSRVAGRHVRFLRSALVYVAAYYGLWASADLLILSGLDLGWGLRVVPNQLYYAFWVPFLHVLFFVRR
jgi:hypothetical protein